MNYRITRVWQGLQKLNTGKMVILIVLGIFVGMSLFISMFLISLFGRSQYDIADLEVTQEKTNLKLSWSNEGAFGYEVFLICKGKRPERYSSDKNEALINAKELGITYRCIVLARNKRGGLSSATIKKVETKKVPQKIKLDKEQYSGIKGNQGIVRAKAHGKVRFITSNEKILTVSDDGIMCFKEKGEATVAMSVREGPQYKAAKGTFKVMVYPDRLDVPVPKVSYKSSQVATISWSPVKYAKSYELTKFDPVTGNYVKVADLADKETSKDVLRNKTKYRVIAKTKIDDNEIDSGLSEDAVITTFVDDAEAYKSFHNRKTLDHSAVSLVTEISGEGEANVPQSMSLVNGNYVVAFVDKAGKKGVLSSYGKDGTFLGSSKISGMGHANGSTYCPVTDKIYTVKTHKMIWSPSCTTYKVGDGYSKEDFNLPKNTSGIAYDKTENKFFLSKGNELYVTDSNFKVEKFHWKKIRYNHAQDIGAYDGVLLVCTWVSGDESYIDMYRSSDGAYIGGYDVPIGEIESCFVEEDTEKLEKRLVILMNNDKKYGDCILRMDEPIDI